MRIWAQISIFNLRLKISTCVAPVQGPYLVGPDRISFSEGGLSCPKLSRCISRFNILALWLNLYMLHRPGHGSPVRGVGFNPLFDELCDHLARLNLLLLLPGAVSENTGGVHPHLKVEKAVCLWPQNTFTKLKNYFLWNKQCNSLLGQPGRFILFNLALKLQGLLEPATCAKVNLHHIALKTCWCGLVNFSCVMRVGGLNTISNRAKLYKQQMLAIFIK